MVKMVNANHITSFGCFQKIGVFPPKWMVQKMENPMNKWMIWGVLTPIFGNIHFFPLPFVSFRPGGYASDDGMEYDGHGLDLN